MGRTTERSCPGLACGVFNHPASGGDFDYTRDQFDFNKSTGSEEGPAYVRMNDFDSHFRRCREQGAATNFTCLIKRELAKRRSGPIDDMTFYADEATSVTREVMYLEVGEF